MPDRASKRRKPRPSKQPTAGPSTSSTQPRLFAPFRALGHVTNHIPFSIFVHAPKGALATPTVNFVTSVGRSWMMWDAGRMTLVFVGSDAGEDIRALAQTGTEVFASVGSKIIRYVRGKEASGVVRRDSEGDKVN